MSKRGKNKGKGKPQPVAAKAAPVADAVAESSVDIEAGAQHAEDVAVGHDGRDRDDAGTERLAEDVEVGHDALVVARERRAGLPLVQHQQVQ